MKNPVYGYEPCHCYFGSPQNPVVFSKIEYSGDKAILKSDKPFVDKLKCHCQDTAIFYFVICPCLNLCDHKKVYISDGCTPIELDTPWNQYCQVDELVPYCNRRKVVKCQMGYYPLRATLKSYVAPRYNSECQCGLDCSTVNEE